VDHDRVVDTRPSDDGLAVRRRRQCNQCKRRFTTYEYVEPAFKVIKKDGARVPFDREKLKRGLEKACWKRPISDARLEGVVSELENYIAANFASEVESRTIGELAMQQLRELDQVAYVRFASVYRRFEDVRDFVDELAPMLSERMKEEG
jgi:transcriptional repressor NrdR